MTYECNYFLLFAFLLGSITIEIRTLKAVKKRTYFVSLVALLSSRTQVDFENRVDSGGIQVNFYNSVEQVVGKTSDPGTC